MRQANLRVIPGTDGDGYELLPVPIPPLSVNSPAPRRPDEREGRCRSMAGSQYFRQNRSTFAAYWPYNKDVMNTVRSTFRYLITASLLLSLSATSLYPRLMAGEALGATVEANHGKRVCCCGTEDGRCCGKACCQLPNPKEDKAPTSPKPSHDRGQPLGLAQVAGVAVVGPNAAAFHDGFVRDAARVGSSSLIALSIRFNI